MHVEIDNLSEHRIALSLVDLHLDTAFFRLAENPLCNNNSNSSHQAANITASKQLTLAVPGVPSSASASARRSSSMSNSAPQSVLLSPGDRFTGLFHFVPIQKGAAQPPQLAVQW